MFGLVAIPTGVEVGHRRAGRSASSPSAPAIVRDDGGAIAFRHAFIRALIGLLEIYATSGGLAALVGLLNARRSVSATCSPAPTASTSASPKARRAGLRRARLTSALGAALPTSRGCPIPRPAGRAVPRQVARHGPGTRATAAADLAGEASVYVSPLPERDPETFLVRLRPPPRREFAALAARAAAWPCSSRRSTGCRTGSPSAVSLPGQVGSIPPSGAPRC